jgi:hypothetical protein
VLLAILLASMITWSGPVSAQPMCPIDQIWDEETGDCVALDPLETSTPSPTAETESDSPDDEIPTETPTEEDIPEDIDDAESPEMDNATPDDEATNTSGAQFSIFGWDPFGFEGPTPDGWMDLYSCNRPVNAGDTFDSLMPDCWRYTDTSSALGFNIYVNGQYRETMGAGDDLYLNDTLPVGEVGIQAFYPDDFQAPWVDCHVYHMDDDDPVTTYLYPWVPQGRAMLTMPTEHPESRIACAWFFAPNTVMAVDAYAYTCPAYVTDQTIQYNDLLSSCPGSSETEMQLLSEDGIQNRMADMGWSPFRNVTLGTVQIRGFPPDGYGNPLVYCMVLGGGGQTTKGLDLEIIGNQGYVTIEDTLPGGIVRCDFFYRET